MGKFKLTDRHYAFASAVAAGEDQYKAYLQHISDRASKASAMVASSELVKRPEVSQLIELARKEREAAIFKAQAESIPKELKTLPLSLDQMDAFHYSVIMGTVEVEEVIPQFQITEDLDPDTGKVIRRRKTTSFVKVKRPANIRERQKSISELYKRFGNYAPLRGLLATGKVSEDSGPDEAANVPRHIILSDGTKLPF